MQIMPRRRLDNPSYQPFARALVQTYEYQGTGQLVERGLGNGNTITYDWDAHRLTGIQETGPDAVAFSYGYDAMDRRNSQTMTHAPSLAQEHVYDSLGRLTALTRPSATNMATAATWDLDAAHNWDTYTATGIGATSEQRTHDATHSIEAIDDGSVEAYTHDANDNRLRDGTYTYEWDAFNRLRVVKGASDGALIAEYDYDARDRRLTKTLPTGIESFVYDGEDVVAEYLQGALIREYVHGPGYDEPLALLEDSNGDGSTTSPGDRRFFFVSDALGSIVQLEDESGQAVQGYVYEAYGETRVLPASGDIDWTSLGGAPVVENPYGYTGQRLDPETGLYYYKARYYDSHDGRFLSRDPIGVWGDVTGLGNGMAYGAGSPFTYTDPTGRAVAYDTTCGGFLGWDCWGRGGSWYDEDEPEPGPAIPAPGGSLGSVQPSSSPKTVVKAKSYTNCAEATGAWENQLGELGRQVVGMDTEQGPENRHTIAGVPESNWPHDAKMKTTALRVQRDLTEMGRLCPPEDHEWATQNSVYMIGYANEALDAYYGRNPDRAPTSLPDPREGWSKYGASFSSPGPSVAWVPTGPVAAPLPAYGGVGGIKPGGVMVVPACVHVCVGVAVPLVEMPYDESEYFV